MLGPKSPQDIIEMSSVTDNHISDLSENIQCMFTCEVRGNSVDQRINLRKNSDSVVKVLHPKICFSRDNWANS